MGFLSKVECVPKSVVQEIGAYFRGNASPGDVIGMIGNTRKVVLSALYAEVLKRSTTHATRIEELVRSTEAGSVSRLDLVTRIIELDKVFNFDGSLSCADSQTDKRWQY